MLNVWLENLNHAMTPALWAQLGAAPGTPAPLRNALPASFGSFAIPRFAGLPGAADATAEHVRLSTTGMPDLKIAPEKIQQLQSDYARECTALLQKFISSDVTGLELSDRRFSSEAWRATPGSAFAAAWYLLNSRFLNALAEAIDADTKTRERVRFALEQWTAATAPSNFFALNPEAQKVMVESQGESLRQGILNLLKDMNRGRITQTDEARFAVGKNLASTEGAVVYQNDLIQLIQYTPQTSTVFEKPLLIVPPCINKYYILDLNPENSLVRYALEQGHQVFMISWRNPDESLAGKTWDDYINDGVLQAIEVVKTISARATINTLGFCVGGTLLSAALAVRAARGERSAASLTLLTSMLDFSDTGVLDVFIDEAQVQKREQAIGGKGGTPPGLMRGSEFNSTFAFLRPNDLVWNYVVDNYLKGRTPPPFDLLFWNSDSTNLPGPMMAWYLRHAYLENNLRKPGAVKVCDTPVDLGMIDVPTFIYGSREDHIVPWKTAYESTRLLKGPMQFVLGASGHIAGVINPPAKNKRSYWTATQLPESADAWLAAASETHGSWWPEWASWLEQQGGKRIKPRAKLGHAKHPVLEAAPGSYVMQAA
jgi:polyhydroxyalkanoate synthase subunit PhaC